MLPPVDGKETTKQTFKGGMTMTIVTAESSPPTHLVREMSDAGGPMVGSWTYEISPASDGSQVVLTEEATFKIPADGQNLRPGQTHGRAPGRSWQTFRRDRNATVVDVATAVSAALQPP